EGQGLEPATADVSVVAKFTESTIEDYKFNGIAAYLALSTGNLQGTLEGNGAFGSFAVRPVIKDLMGDPAYNVSLDARNLNLAIITGTDTLSSDINLSAYLVGQSFDPEKISASADVRVFNSTFQDIHLDTVFAEVHYMHENVRIDSLMLV